MINLLTYSPKYSNNQKLLFEILNKIDDFYYDIQFEIDGLILNNIHIDDIFNGECYHPNYKVSKTVKYYYHKCYQDILIYKTQAELFKKNQNLYQVLYRNKWLKSLSTHMKNGRIKHTIETVHKVALLCNTRKEFSLKYPNEYDAALKRLNCLDIVCKHMEKYVNQLKYKRIIYAYIFHETKTIYIGLTKDFKTRNKNRHTKKTDSVTKYKLKTNLIPEIKMLTDFLEPEEAQIQEINFIKEYELNGWILLNQVKGGSLGGRKIYAIL